MATARARLALERARARIERRRFWWVVGCIAAALILLSLIHLYVYSVLADPTKNEEPFRIYEGVSVWPAWFFPQMTITRVLALWADLLAGGQALPGVAGASATTASRISQT